MTCIKQVAISVILISVFAVVSFVVVVPFPAETQFNSARKLVAEYLWKDANAKLEQAIAIDPFNSQYPAALGEFLFTQSNYKDNKAPLLKAAAKCYERANCLNPRCAEYYAKLGQINIRLFIDGAGKKKYLDKAFEDFRKAIENDPNGFNTAYAVGYSGLAVWKELKEEERVMVIDRLRYALKQKPWYSQYIYPRLLQETRNVELLESVMPDLDLEQWVTPEKIKSLKKDVPQAGASNIISRSAWRGLTADGKNVYANGNMYWSGTIYGAMLLPEGPARVIIEAGGSPVNGIYPYMLVSLDGKKTGAAYVDSSGYKEYVFDVNTNGGVKILGVTFTNDDGNNKEDRNLFIGDARIERR
ncbi:MAG: carbohydrate-binding domain-containing protein [Candidatus Omnitrophica bacterium]|nr:carbohydrate-binding domain-containing protein [Candidatus Omnitrophota bacterium]